MTGQRSESQDRWEIAYCGSDEVQRHLADGWEPYAIVWVQASKFSETMRHYFKRPSAGQKGHATPEPRSAATLPERLTAPWDVTARIIWLALDEADIAYDIAADVVKALDASGHFGRHLEQSS